MKDTLYFWLDSANSVILAFLLCFLLKGMLPERFFRKNEFCTLGILCLQFTAVRQILLETEWMKRLIYGGEMFMKSSRQSIVPLAVSISATLLAGMFLYKGERMKLLSLVTVFYALLELIRFFFYPLAVGSGDLVFYFYGKSLLEKGTTDSLEAYIEILERMELVWNIVMPALMLLFLVFCIRRYKKALVAGGTTYRRGEAALLFIPGLMGLVFSVMLRSILFSYKNQEYNSIVEDFPELNFIIPCLSLLSILSILMSVKMLDKIAEEYEKRRQAEFYQSRIEEMEDYVRDMENVQLKMLGMKHDMKNHIANINVMLARTASEGAQTEEVRRYVDSLQLSLNDTDRTYQTGNSVTDVIVGRYESLAEQKGIAFAADFTYPRTLGIDVFDIGIVLNNALDNAFEACENETEHAVVELFSGQKGNMFFITVHNSFTGTLKWSDGLPVSGKAGYGHGLGLKNIKNSAEKYYGRMQLQAKDGLFCITVMLQGNRIVNDRN